MTHARTDAFHKDAARRQKPASLAALTHDRLTAGGHGGRGRRKKRRRLGPRSNALIESHLPLVRHVAERLARRLPAQVDVDDLISAGIFGLINALATFEPARGVKFTTYCVPCVRGAILDQLREMDWVPRLARSRGRKLREAVQIFEARLGRSPSDDELLDRLRVPIAALRRMQRDARTVRVISIDAPAPNWGFARESGGAAGYTAGLANLLHDRREARPDERSEVEDWFEWISRGCTARERFIISCLRRGETLRRIGGQLGLSESRVSQIRSATLARLQRRAAHRM